MVLFLHDSVPFIPLNAPSPTKLTKMLGSCFSYRGFIITSTENILTEFKR